MNDFRNLCKQVDLTLCVCVLGDNINVDMQICSLVLSGYLKEGSSDEFSMHLSF
jgi:hypothetical protein